MVRCPKNFFEFLQVGRFPTEMITKQQEQLYQEMYELTKPKCGECRAPHSCCDPFTCEVVKEYAKEQGQDFELIDGMFLDENHRCIIPPHLRPLCTLHICSINGMGCDPKDPQWTKKYFQLRVKIEQSHGVKNG